MQYVYIIVLGLHVLAGVFWAGTTIAVGRDPEIRAERFFRPQMGAAGMVFLTGILLWYFFHEGVFGSMEKVLALGIVTALIAAGVQGALVGSASRQLGGADTATQTKLRARMTKGERIAGGLLVITVLCMATARMF
ncbi:MAG: hypothetical protein EOR30_21680 [Mesorhizobium sp.]|uniref:hypothetical protein n=1 Tax=unclassified Mesorhizobium TaxID=325217 RepID=UPI000FCB5510|nr:MULTISPECIES: hypothetical protein [unclassified Mesorhizobium]RUV67934.1 hypothetical protein EOA78_28535 [Mesorhizobium sp. M5C.F.Cr.IN.023.01.1.1]RWF89007.1 MAG: hypothetical protein EOQ36_06350 [Mesorhizobium sp.]RWF95566.1 MAG: hypothetical protein EOQ45_07640 [Mesorhizobium sp.]RWI40186.1 MAG: hypothetical protein EOR14_16315 [Mesorhizobium sp.]RWI45848.1 MAG: hypothetical protein EOR15_20270 [Mesorhizobium sp.]